MSAFLFAPFFQWHFWHNSDILRAFYFKLFLLFYLPIFHRGVVTPCNIWSLSKSFKILIFFIFKFHKAIFVAILALFCCTKLIGQKLTVGIIFLHNSKNCFSSFSCNLSRVSLLGISYTQCLCWKLAVLETYMAPQWFSQWVNRPAFLSVNAIVIPPLSLLS